MSLKKLSLPLSLAILAISACSGEEQTNISLHRCAMASSNFDSNLTAQLVTDGIVQTEEPVYIEVRTSDGPVGKDELEASIDLDDKSRNIVTGSSGWIEYRFHGRDIRPDMAQVYFREALKNGRGGEKHYEDLRVEKRDDGWFRINFTFPNEGRWRILNVDFFQNGERLTGILPSGHFSSAWLSEGTGAEWLAIDLGEVCRVSGANILWISGAVNTSAQLSKDGIKWSRPWDAARLKGRARYVRFNFEGAHERICISEIEILGRRSTPKEDVDPAWMMIREPETCATPEEISTPGFDAGAWLPATVPGTVLSTYIDLGAVPDPDFGDNASQISDSYFNCDWWYRREFTREAKAPGKRYWLDFDGINWKAEIYLNGAGVGCIEGAFKRGRFDITDLLTEGRNALAVKIIHNAHPGSVKVKNARWTGYNGGCLGADNPSFHASIGWDWMTTIRGRNCGIWNKVAIVQKGAAEVSDPLVQSRIGKDGRASVTATVCVNTDSPVEVEGWIGDIRFEKKVSASGEVSFTPEEFPQLKDTPLQLWWPCGYGNPVLYDAGFRVKCGGEVSDSVCYKAGIRQICTSEDGGALKIYVNGRRVNPRGGNWGFCQQNLRYSEKDYRTAVEYHAQMHFNMIRNWVGQIGHEEFWQACDECGIMVWQDFWLANPSDGPDPDDEDMFLANARDLVHRIRRHPCIALYCGRNEGYPPATLDRALKNDVVALEHSDITYISSSADGPIGGRGPYRALRAEDYFSSPLEKFHSERGLPAVPVHESLCKMMPVEDRWPQGEMWGKHDFTRDGAQQAATYNQILEKAFGPVGSAEEYCALAQWINYTGYRAIFESANSWGRQGMLLWMSHPCWPSMVWQTYDYYFQPGGAFFGSKKGAEQLHIQYNPVSGLVEVVNNGCGDLRELLAKVHTYDYKGECLSSTMSVVNVPDDSTVQSVEIEKPGPDVPVYYIQLALTTMDGGVYSENFYIEGAESGNLQALRELPAARLEKEVVEDNGCKWVSIRNTGTVPALNVRVILQDKDGHEILPVEYTDNYICIMPGEEKHVGIYSEHDSPASTIGITQLGDWKK